MFWVIAIIIAIIAYFVWQKPYDDSQNKAAYKAAELSKKFGNVKIDAVEFRDVSSSDIFRVYVIFEEDGYINPAKKYEIVEISYKSEPEKERFRKATYARAVLSKMPYGKYDYGGSSYNWDKYLERRAKGVYYDM